MKKRLMIVGCAVAVLAGCTSVQVRQVNPGVALQDVCIEYNEKVVVEDFVPIVQDGFARNGVRTRVVNLTETGQCEFVLAYTALRGWDLTPYLTHAELQLRQRGTQIGSGVFHLKGRGGLAPTKWRSTREKMDPVIDQLLAGVRSGEVIATQPK